MARILAHLVAGYPSYEASYTVARALLDAGVWGLEVQFPFSDPTADGPVIQNACTKALDGGFTADAGLRLIRRISAQTQAPVFVMAYAAMPVARGVSRFCSEAAEAGATGLIVPDLPPDSDEGLYDAGLRHSLAVVPVLVSGIREERLEAAYGKNPQYVYVALRRGITGARTELGQENITFLKELSRYPARIVAGFGVRERDQVKLLQPWVHSVVVGSAFVRRVAEAADSTGKAIYEAVYATARELVGPEGAAPPEGVRHESAPGG